MKKQDQILCNQIAIMNALIVLMCHLNADKLGPMNLTWQFNQLKAMSEESMKLAP